jgi:hypothetical protein
VNPWEWLHTLGDAGYHKNEVEAGEVDEVYNDDKLLYSFNIDPDSPLESLLGDPNDVTFPKEREQQISKKKKCDIFNILDIWYYILCIWYYVLDISYQVFSISYGVLDIWYYVLATYSHVLVFNKMPKKLKVVTKKLSGERVTRGQRTPFLGVVL